MKKWICLMLTLLLVLGSAVPAFAMEVTYDERWEVLFTHVDLKTLLMEEEICQSEDIVTMIAMDAAKGPGDENLIVILATYGSNPLMKRGAMLVYNADTDELMDLGEGVVQGNLPLGRDRIGDISVSAPMLFWLGGNDEAADPSSDQTLYVTDDGMFVDAEAVPGAYAMDSHDGYVVVMGTVGTTSQSYVQFFSESGSSIPIEFAVEGDYTMNDMVYWDPEAKEVVLCGYENRLALLEVDGETPNVSYKDMEGLPAGMTAGYLDRIARTDRGQLAFASDGDICCGVLDEDMNLVWHLEDGQDPYIQDIAAVGNWFYICGDDGLYRTEMDTMSPSPLPSKSQGRPRSLVQARIYKQTMWAEMEHFGLLAREFNEKMDYLVPLRGAANKIVLFLPIESIQNCLNPIAGDAVILWRNEEIRIPFADLDPCMYLDQMKGYESIGIEVILMREGNAWQIRVDLRGDEERGDGSRLIHRIRLIP